MKRILIVLLALPFFASAQNKALNIEGASPNLYITHAVAPKENYYSIGRLYNISPKEIAPFNKLELEKGLSLNQVIKVPLTTNFSQDGIAAADEALVPLYHTVKEKEGLFRIATTYNKLPLETLKKWNNISGDAVGNGTKLIVGYLKVKKELSAFSGMAKAVVPVAANPAPAKEVVVVKETPKPEAPKQAEKKQEKETPVVAKKEEKLVVKEPVAVKKEVEKNEEKPAPPVAEAPKAKNQGGGFFKNIFADQSKSSDMDNETGTAAVFKSTSGWEDGKYYCLHNGAATGTIVKITSPSTGKSVYAKVLDVMPDIKQNNGVIIRLSNAAAAELGQAEGKFDCTLSYSK